MKRPIYTFLFVAAALLGFSELTQAQEKVTLGSLLEEMTSRESLTRYPDHTIQMVSSRDRRSISPDQEGWFANDDYSGYEYYDTLPSGRIERVMMDYKGAGAVTRLWMTALDKRGTLRFYFDGESEPRWVVPAYDMMRSGLALDKGFLFSHTSYKEPINEIGGSSCYLPLPFAKGLKITLEEEVVPNKNYYQIEYRRYAEGVEVESFRPELVATYATEIAAAENALNEKPALTATSSKKMTLDKGGVDYLTLPKGSKAVHQLTINTSRYDGESMRRLIVVGEFDGVQTIWCPLSDFATAGMGVPRSECHYVKYDASGDLTLWWVMPYRKSARIGIINLGDEVVDVEIGAAVEKYKWDNRSLYFHASWQSRTDVPLCGNPYTPTNAECHDERSFEAKGGRGVFVGNLLSVYNHAKSWYGEGDAKIWVDDDSFPSIFGTGLEDYYNASWAPLVLYSTPYGGAVRADLASSQGYNAFLRTRLLDAVPFSEKICFDVEIMGWSPGKVDYDAATFWYGDSAVNVLGTSGKEEALRPLPPSPPSPYEFKIEGAIEIEDIANVEYVGFGHENQDMTAFAQGDWSRGRQITCFGGKVGDYAEFRLGGYDDTKNYTIEWRGCKAADYGAVEISICGESAAVVDCYDTAVRDTGNLMLGTYAPVGGEFVVRVILAGRNPLAVGDGNLVGMDCIRIIEQ